MRSSNFITFLLIIFFGGSFLSSSQMNYANGLVAESITDPLSDLYCEALPLSEEFCNKASENKAILETNAESVISKCLSNSSSAGCIPSMKHLIKTCESFNYLLGYCDKEKLVESIFHEFYEIEKQYGETAALIIEAAAVEGGNESGLKSPKNITPEEIEALINKANAINAENTSSNATETAMDKSSRILDEASRILSEK